MKANDAEPVRSIQPPETVERESGESNGEGADGRAAGAFDQNSRSTLMPGSGQG